MYMVNKIQEQQTGGGEGVEVLINKPFENEEFGRGQYTSKIYHLQRCNLLLILNILFTSFASLCHCLMPLVRNDYSYLMNSLKAAV